MKKLVSLIVLLLLLTDAGAAFAAPKINTFERPARGSAYTLSQWALDGWNAPWDNGMSTRTWIDGYNFNHSGGQSLRVFYPQGQIDPPNSGAQAPFEVTPGREYYLSYWVRFSSDYSWGTTEFAGKLGLGLAGGGACSGGIPCTGYNGFTSRMIWRSGGQAAIYYYHMDDAGQYGDYAVLKNPNGSDIYYPKGTWVNIVQRLKVNTVTNGNANPDGEIQIWYNGVSAANITGLRFVRNTDLVDKAYFSSFFGGATSSFAPANDSYVWYDDLKVSTNRADICELSTGDCFTRTFQAEDYTSMSGVMKETTPDTGGGQNVGGIDSQDWIAFSNVQIPRTGTYLVEYRVATPNNNGKISLDINSGATVLGEINVPNTGSFSSYRTVSHVVQITAGTYQFGLYAVTGGFDINWWKITQLY
ncbi:carbohydrate-binding protein [Cohnella hashimotonis]|uniref:Carbohydrate-binding protein n=1 Tax=Cohnella hashimotonis TaxID=2826895 RepID=A0ABT6TCQ3_9BACL|nr:carbohydrate-binding protein [Cohnella hashimotonis]MDI4644549.1 carbohydrate-binding protein [Cohnella hashimotonis]